MFFKLGMVNDIYKIVKWHRSCNFEANDKCLDYALELKNYTTSDPYDDEVSTHSQLRNFFSYFRRAFILFFLISFYGTGIPWFSLSLGDLAVKVFVALVMLIPFRLLLGRVKAV